MSIDAFRWMRLLLPCCQAKSEKAGIERPSPRDGYFATFHVLGNKVSSNVWDRSS